MAPILEDTDVTMATVVSIGTFETAPSVVWRAFAEREIIGQWYGPRDWPATFEEHELVAGATSLYHLTGPGDALDRGFLQIIAVEGESRLEFTDGHRDDDGAMSPEFLHAIVELEASGRGSRLSVTQRFADRNRMGQLMLKQLEDVVGGLA